jgi:hypothetical protein
MELNRKRRVRNWLDSKEGKCGQGQNRTADTRIFSPLTVARLSVTNGRQVNKFKRMKRLWDGSSYRLGQIGANSSGKVVTKWR